mgnify:FL=1
MIFVVVLLLVSVSIAVVFGLLFRRTAQYERLVLSYEAERTAGSLVESYLRGAITESTTLEELPESVASFGIYAGDGGAILRIGEAPLRLPPETLPDSGAGAPLQRPSLSPLDGSRLRVLRPVRMTLGAPRGPGMTPGAGMGPGMSPGGGRRMMPGVDPVEMALVDLDASALLTGQRNRRFASIVVVGITLFLGLLVVRAYQRLRDSEVEGQRNARLAQLGAAARTLTHEIRNPLAAIRLQTAILQKQLPAEHQDKLSVLNDEVGRIGSLVDDVRSFLRGPGGRIEAVDLGEAARDLIARVGYSASLRVEGDNHTICIDRSRLRSILGNVLDNATQAVGSAASAAGDPGTSSIEVTIAPHRDRVVLAVADSGPGVPSDIRDRVFDPFFTTKASGSGIGLAIVRRFVEDAGGKVSLEERPGGGTILRIDFPRGVDCATTDS